MTSLSDKGAVECAPAVQEERSGLLTHVQLPLTGGGKIGIYQPKHPTALDLAARVERAGECPLRTFLGMGGYQSNRAKNLLRRHPSCANQLSRHQKRKLTAPDNLCSY